MHNKTVSLKTEEIQKRLLTHGPNQVEEKKPHRIEIWGHKINKLAESDFVLAAKINQILSEELQTDDQFINYEIL